MIRDLSLLALALAKVGWLCGFAPGILAALFYDRFAAPRVGKLYRIEGHYLGSFEAEVLGVDRECAKLEITDPLRRPARIENRCAYPFCVKTDFHSGEHELTRFREGGVIEIFWRSAKFVEIAASSGAGQLAISSKRPSGGRLARLRPVELAESRNTDGRATSPARKEWRRA